MKYLLFNARIRDKVSLFLTTNIVSRSLFGSNRSIIHNKTIARALIEYYDGDDGHQADISTGNLGYGLLHYSIILNCKPTHILCIGSRKGYIPAICSLACIENGVGTVDFVDAGYDSNDKNNWSGIGWWKKVNPLSHFSFLDVHKSLRSFIMTTDEFARLYPHKKYDYIYIDGDHSYKGVTHDWKLFWPKLSKNGFMVFHDVSVRYTKELGSFGVWKLWRKLVKKHSIQFLLPKRSGLGILQKIT